jgi:hypothetical protein
MGQPKSLIQRKRLSSTFLAWPDINRQIYLRLSHEGDSGVAIALLAGYVQKKSLEKVTRRVEAVTVD